MRFISGVVALVLILAVFGQLKPAILESAPKAYQYSVTLDGLHSVTLDGLQKTEGAPPGTQQLAARFPIGIFEDAGMMRGNPSRFATMLKDIQAHGLDSVMLTGSSLEKDDDLYAVADQTTVLLHAGPHWELDREWWPASVPADPAVAQDVISRQVAQLKTHPSVRGYYVKDEPDLAQMEKTTLAVQAFRQADPARQVFPVLIGLDRVGPIMKQLSLRRL